MKVLLNSFHLNGYTLGFHASFKNSSPREKVAKLSSFWNWWVESLFVSITVAKNNIFFSLTWQRALARKKNSGESICSRYRVFEHTYVYWIWLRGSASYVIISSNNIYLWKCQKDWWEKRRKVKRTRRLWQNSWTSAHRRSQAKYRLVQTSSIKRISKQVHTANEIRGKISTSKSGLVLVLLQIRQ